MHNNCRLQISKDGNIATLDALKGNEWLEIEIEVTEDIKKLIDFINN